MANLGLQPCSADPLSDGASDVTVDGGSPSPGLRVLICKMRRVFFSSPGTKNVSFLTRCPTVQFSSNTDSTGEGLSPSGLHPRGCQLQVVSGSPITYTFA